MSAKKSLKEISTQITDEVTPISNMTRIEGLVDGNNVSIYLNCRGKEGDLAVLKVTTKDEETPAESSCLSKVIFTLCTIGVIGVTVYYFVKEVKQINKIQL